MIEKCFRVLFNANSFNNDKQLNNKENKCSLRQFLGKMYPLICKTSRWIARKEIVFDLNHCRNVLLTPMCMVTYNLTPTEPLQGAAEMH